MPIVLKNAPEDSFVPTENKWIDWTIRWEAYRQIKHNRFISGYKLRWDLEYISFPGKYYILLCNELALKYRSSSSKSLVLHMSSKVSKADMQ